MHPTETTLVVLFSHSLGLTDTGGVLPYKPYRYVHPKGYDFWSENVYALYPWYGFWGNCESV